MSPRAALLTLLLSPLAACALLPQDESIVEAPPSAKATQLALGRLHTCALTDKGRVRCWGYNEFGQVGTGDPRYYKTPESDLIDLHQLINTPIEVKGLENVVAISASSQSEFNCALTGAGDVYCWGLDVYGQLGTGVTYNDSRKRESPTPLQVTGISGAKAISVGATHACALTATGGVMCWGTNERGQLGDGSRTSDDPFDIPYKNAPVAVPGISGATAIAAGYSHTCAILGNGGLSCWGSNDYGESGGDAADEARPETLTTPVTVPGLSSGVGRVFVGISTTCAVMTGGELRCFGRELGLGSALQLSSPAPIAVTPIPELAPIDAISIELFTSHVSCAVVGGGARCWGDNFYSCLGHNAGEPDYGFTTWVPVDVLGLTSGVTDVQVGAGHACALLGNGAVKCWGDRITGNGDESGTRLPSQSPQSVVSLP